MSKRPHRLNAKIFKLDSEEQTLALGGSIARVLNHRGAVLYLFGSLGAGKTTLSRGILRQLGHIGSVKSPTFTLVESYNSSLGQRIYHFDLYRLTSPEELYFIGARDYFTPESLCLIEWPEHGIPMLPSADLEVRIEIVGRKRHIIIEAPSDRGQQWLVNIAQVKS